MHKIFLVLGIIFGICSCSSDDISNGSYSYQIQGITAYKGQDVSSLFDANGAPNAVKRLDNDKIMWVYYTNYRPVGGGEIISYDEPTNLNNATTCVVRVILSDDEVDQVFTNCS